MPSFDVVSELDSHEVTNAVDQANRELSQRFDFKDTGAVFELNDLTVAVKAQVEFQLKQMLEILKLRLSKRGIDVMCLEIKDPVVNLAVATQEVILRQGVDADTARLIVRLIKTRRSRCRRACRARRCASAASSAMICKAPWRCCARPRSTCRCSSIISATEPHQ